MILSHRRLLSSGTNFTRIWRCSEPNMGAVYWVQASFSKELRQMKKTAAKAKTDHWTTVQFFLDTHLLQVSNISSVQPPPASGANPPEPHLVGGQSHKSVVRFRHFASLPLLHLHGVLPPDKLYKNSPNSDKTRPLAAKLCPGPTWWAVPSVGDFIHQIYLQVISTSSSCRGG